MFNIYIIGPESTGKTTLTLALAKHFNGLYALEYARQYLKNNVAYHQADIKHIFNGQEKQRQDLYQQNKVLCFFDTDENVLRVWSEIVFNTCDITILDKIADDITTNKIYLLLDVNLPWEYDALRENPSEDERKYLFFLYKTYLIDQPYAWKIISGEGQYRTQQAITFIEQMMANKDFVKSNN